jgi:hypothetical protein
MRQSRTFRTQFDGRVDDPNQWRTLASNGEVLPADPALFSDLPSVEERTEEREKIFPRSRPDSVPTP